MHFNDPSLLHFIVNFITHNQVKTYETIFNMAFFY